ncbi:MAG UNVERIFIED_CONTAM: hypothetical protein LVR18_44120 [Planctomycetaceae bacterium]|jgi:hypothetical protein
MPGDTGDALDEADIMKQKKIRLTSITSKRVADVSAWHKAFVDGQKLEEFSKIDQTPPAAAVGYVITLKGFHFVQSQRYPVRSKAQRFVGTHFIENLRKWVVNSGGVDVPVGKIGISHPIIAWFDTNDVRYDPNLGKADGGLSGGPGGGMMPGGLSGGDMLSGGESGGLAPGGLAGGNYGSAPSLPGGLAGPPSGGGIGGPGGLSGPPGLARTSGRWWTPGWPFRRHQVVSPALQGSVVPVVVTPSPRRWPSVRRKGPTGHPDSFTNRFRGPVHLDPNDHSRSQGRRPKNSTPGCR